MGTGEHRATLAAEKAISSPLLETSIEGARSILLSITGGAGPLADRGRARPPRSSGRPPTRTPTSSSAPTSTRTLTDQVWITVIATRFDSAFSNRHRRDRRAEPREPRSPDRDAALRPERYSDPAADWRFMKGQPRSGSADELYGDGVSERRGVGPSPGRAALDLEDRVLDVPEFKPED